MLPDKFPFQGEKKIEKERTTNGMERNEKYPLESAMYKHLWACDSEHVRIENVRSLGVGVCARMRLININNFEWICIDNLVAGLSCNAFLMGMVRANRLFWKYWSAFRLHIAHFSQKIPCLIIVQPLMVVKPWCWTFSDPPSSVCSHFRFTPLHDYQMTCIICNRNWSVCHLRNRKSGSPVTCRSHAALCNVLKQNRDL